MYNSIAFNTLKFLWEIIGSMHIIYLVGCLIFGFAVQFFTLRQAKRSIFCLLLPIISVALVVLVEISAVVWIQGFAALFLVFVDACIYFVLIGCLIGAIVYTVIHRKRGTK